MTGEPKLICTLPIEQVPGQLAEWGDLAGAVISRQKLPDGVELVLPARFSAAVADLAAREAACCPFLELEVIGDGDKVRFRITSGTPDADQLIETLTGGTR